MWVILLKISPLCIFASKCCGEEKNAILGSALHILYRRRRSSSSRRHSARPLYPWSYNYKPNRDSVCSAATRVSFRSIKLDDNVNDSSATFVTYDIDAGKRTDGIQFLYQATRTGTPSAGWGILAAFRGSRRVRWCAGTVGKRSHVAPTARNAQPK